VTAELEKLAAQESSNLTATTEAASSDKPADEQSASTLERITGAAAEQERKNQLSHNSVSKEVEELRKKLAERKKLEELDPAVEKARDELIQCLRYNDRRPLDCWEQREAFKQAVGRLEKQFVERTIR
jgi:MICOS complex subunit MIC19